jgi:hypothetical protein
VAHREQVRAAARLNFADSWQLEACLAIRQQRRAMYRKPANSVRLPHVLRVMVHSKAQRWPPVPCVRREGKGSEKGWAAATREPGALAVLCKVIRIAGFPASIGQARMRRNPCLHERKRRRDAPCHRGCAAGTSRMSMQRIWRFTVNAGIFIVGTLRKKGKKTVTIPPKGGAVGPNLAQNHARLVSVSRKRDRAFWGGIRSVAGWTKSLLIALAKEKGTDPNWL